MSWKAKNANTADMPDMIVSTMKYVDFSKYPKKKVVTNPAIRLEKEYNNWNMLEYLPLSC